jgi:hypothetical protein
MRRIYGWIVTNRHFPFLITALSLYVASCATFAMDEPEKSSMRGFSDGPWYPPAREMGWQLLLMGLFFPICTLAWWGNIAFFLSVVCFCRRRYQWAFALGVVALCLGAATWIECRHEQKYVGYYLWQASHLSVALGSLWAWRSVRKQPISQIGVLR